MTVPAPVTNQPVTPKALTAGQNRPHPPHIPSHFPEFPDPHTYIKTPVSDYDWVAPMWCWVRSGWRATVQAQGVSGHLSPQTQRTQRPPEGPRRQASSEQHFPFLLSEILVTSCHSVCALLGFPTVIEKFLLKSGNSPLPSSRSNDSLHAHHLPTYPQWVGQAYPCNTDNHICMCLLRLSQICVHIQFGNGPTCGCWSAASPYLRCLPPSSPQKS